MNTLDVIILILFIPGIIRGLTKGFIEQAFTLAGVAAAIWVAIHFSEQLSPYLGTFLPFSETPLRIVAFIILLVVVILLVMLLSSIFTKAMKMATLGWLNRLLGMVLSIGVSALVVGVLIVIFDSVNARLGLVEDSPLLNESVLYPYFRDTAYKIFPLLKELIANASQTTPTVTA